LVGKLRLHFTSLVLLALTFFKPFVLDHFPTNGNFFHRVAVLVAIASGGIAVTECLGVVLVVGRAAGIDLLNHL
jgi:hypothetical protein